MNIYIYLIILSIYSLYIGAENETHKEEIPLIGISNDLWQATELPLEIGFISELDEIPEIPEIPEIIEIPEIPEIPEISVEMDNNVVVHLIDHNTYYPVVTDRPSDDQPFKTAIDIDGRSTTTTTTTTIHPVEEESLIESPYMDKKKTFQSHIAPMVIYFDNMNQTVPEAEIIEGRTSGVTGNESLTGPESPNVSSQEEGYISKTPILEAASVIPDDVLDPRMEACMYLYYEQCHQEREKFSSGEECFLFCHQKKQNDTDALASADWKSFSREGSSREHKILTFKGNGEGKLKVHNKGSSNVFDFLFYIKTFEDTAILLRIVQEANVFIIQLKNGKLGIEIQCAGSKEIFFMEIGGIQDGGWHMCYVLIDQLKGEILMQVDLRRETFFYTSGFTGKTCQFFSGNEDTEIIIGGSATVRTTSFSDENMDGFVGCLTNASMFYSSTYLPITTEQTIQQMELRNVQLSDICVERDIEYNNNNCSVRFGCLSDSKHSNKKICNESQPSSSPIATLRGSDFLSYRLYYWENRISTNYNTFSFMFKSVQKDAILFYASGETPASSQEIQFLSITLTDMGNILFNFNLGGETISLTLGSSLGDGDWHRVSVTHHQSRVSFEVDEEIVTKTLDLESGNYFLYLDPLIFIGGIPGLMKGCAVPLKNDSIGNPDCENGKQKWLYDVKKGACQMVSSCEESQNLFNDATSCLDMCHVNGLASYNFFTGCLKNLIINGLEVLIPDYERQQLYFSGRESEILTCDCHLEQSNSEASDISLRSEDYDFCLEDPRSENCLPLKYRKSCYEYSLLGYNESGQYIIDIDGSGPLPAAHVFCQFDEKGETTTFVDHNVPQRFSNTKINSRYFSIEVTYRDFTKEMLHSLISASESCSQNVSFSCGPEIISFEEVVHVSAFKNHTSNLGKFIPGTCFCTGSENCNHQIHSDSKEEEIMQQVLTIKNKTALPMLQLLFHRKNNVSNPQLEPTLDLGKLICKDKGDGEESFQFHSPESYLVLPAWTTGELRFRFRTTSKRGILLHQPSASFNTPYFTIAINLENSITVSHGLRSYNTSVTFISNHSLTTGEWNTIWIDESDRYLRIFLNDQVKYMQLPFSNSIQMMDGFLILGDPRHFKKVNTEESMSGFTGCVSNLVVNDQQINLQEVHESSGAVDVSAGCKGSCDNQPCKNEATCIELWHSYKCLCENSFAHVGANCETDINENSITFLGSDSEAVYYNSLSVDDVVNPLNSNFTFNIKTNQPKALLFVAQDYIQNVLQIYLENSTTVVLLLNFKGELNEIVVTTGNISLSKGQSVQVAVERLTHTTTLHLLTRGRTFSASIDRGFSLMGEDDYKQYPYEMFIGRAKSHGMTSDLPGLIGCFRGLRINDVTMDFNDVQKWTLGQGISNGCKGRCERNKPCKNGGLCIENFNPSIEEDYTCNCEGTSYYGKACDEETAYTFDGREDGIALYNWAAPYNSLYKITFSYASESLERENELFLFLKLNNTRNLEQEEIILFLRKLTIYLKWRSGGKELVFQNSVKNANSRHYVEVSYSDDTIRFMVDKNIVSLPTSETIVMDDVLQGDIGLIIGGTPELSNDSVNNYSCFRGCISNLNIKTEELNYWPLELYKNGESFIRYGLPKLGQCSVFFSRKATPTFYDFSKISAWEFSEPDIVSLNISDENPVTVSAESSSETSNGTYFNPDPSTGKIWPWALLGSVFFLMVLLLLLCAVRGCCKKSKKNLTDVEKSDARRNDPKNIREEIPLLENEPSRQAHRHVLQQPSEEPPPYSLTPSDDVRQKMENQKTELTPLQEVDEASIVPEEPKEATKPLNIPLNTINRDSNYKIPFKNQLSSDGNALRHIDSSSEESLVRNENLVENGGSDQVSEPDQSSTREEKLQNVEINGAVEDPVQARIPEDQNVDHTIDMKKFYLIRKASEPPKLPPKRK